MSDGRSGLFRGWFVVGAAFAITFAGFGSAYTFGSFLDSLERDFGASRGSVSLVFSLAGFLYFGLGVVTGPLADRWGARRIAVAGMLLLGLGLVLAGRAATLGQVYAAYALGIGLGVGCSYVPALGAVQRWFVRRRGFASGVAVSGIGVGTLAMPPLAAALIAWLGWRDAYLVLGLLVAAAGAGAAMLIEDDPRHRGLRPDGDKPRDGEPGDGEPGDGERGDGERGDGEPGGVGDGLPIRTAVRTRRFLGLYAACLAGSLGVFVPFVHLVPYAVAHQVEPASAVLLLGLIGLGSTAGRFFLGGIADRLGRDAFLVAIHVGMAGTLAIWASAGSFWPLATFALSFGLVYGGWVAILPAIVSDHFGGRNLSGMIGVLYTSVAIGTLIGPSGAGFIFDYSRSYLVPIAICAAANLAAALIALLTARSAGTG